MNIFIIDATTNLMGLQYTGLYSVGDNSVCFREFKFIKTGDVLLVTCEGPSKKDLYDIRIVNSAFISNVSVAVGRPNFNTHENMVVHSSSLLLGENFRGANREYTDRTVSEIVDLSIPFYGGASMINLDWSRDNYPRESNGFSVIRLIPSDFPTVIRKLNNLLRFAYEK